MKQGKKAKPCTSRHQSQGFGVGTKISKNTKCRVVTSRWLLCSIHRTRFICVTNDGCESNGCHSKATRMRRTGSRGSTSLHRSKWKVHHRNLKFQSQNVQTLGFVTQDTKRPKSWSSMEDPVVPLERNLCGHPLAGLLWERHRRNTRLGKVPSCECFLVSREKGLLLSVYVDDKKIGREEPKH